MHDIQEKIFSGAILMVALRLLVKALGLISTMILARLLAPDDFGLIAIVMSVFAFIELINAFGFDVVLIQKQNANDEHYNTVWTLKVFFGVIAAVILFLLSSTLAEYYQDHRLAPLATYLSVMFLINGIANVGVVNFRKELNFKKEFAYEVSIKLTSVIFTVGLAFYLKNYWALVFGMIFNTLVRVAFSYIMNTYRPRFCLSKVKEIYSFSAWLLLNNFLTYLNLKAKDLIIGRLSGINTVGLYSISDEIASLPSTEFVASVNRATYPGYAKVSDNLKKLRALYLNVLSSVAMIGIPASIGIAVAAPVLVPVLLGPKWLAAVPVIHILGFANALISVNTNVGYVFMAIGKPRLSTIYLSTRVIILLSLMVVLTKKYDYLGAAWAVLITSSIMFPLYTIAVSKVISVSVGEYLKAIFRPAFSAACMYSATSYLFYGNLLALSMPQDVSQYGVLDLIIVAGLGATLFLIVDLTIWILMGKPDGLESKLLAKVRPSHSGENQQEVP